MAIHSWILAEGLLKDIVELHHIGLQLETEVLVPLWRNTASCVTLTWICRKRRTGWRAATAHWLQSRTTTIALSCSARHWSKSSFTEPAEKKLLVLLRLKVVHCASLRTYFRMSVGQFELLLAELGPHLRSQIDHVRDPIDRDMFNTAERTASYKCTCCQMQRSDWSVCLLVCYLHKKKINK